MNSPVYRNGMLHIGQIALEDIARRYGTPVYVYSREAIEQQWKSYDQAFGTRDHLICYAGKANSNLAVLSCLAELGSGFDIVSGGELERVLAAGGDPGKTVFSGVGKSAAEMRAALAAGILGFNVESESELKRLDRVAGELGKTAPVSLRVNPDVDAKTHPYIATGLKESKFGVAYDEALPLYRSAAGMANLRIIGVDCHISSQITETPPFIAALQKLLDLIARLSARGLHGAPI